MPSLHVSKGSRVYLASAKLYGEVTKVGALGTTAVVVQCDDGSMKVVCGDLVFDDVVNKSTSKNGRGTSLTLPTDVKVIGPQVLEAFGVDEATRATLFQKFMVLEETVRNEKASYWEQNKDDQSKMSAFLSELLALLNDDTAFIQAKSAKLLRHLDATTRNIMLTNMMSSTTPEERKTMIMEYTTIQNDRVKVTEFLQNMNELLLDNQTYIKMEFKKALAKKGIYEDESLPMIESFLEVCPDSRLSEIVAEWRKMKYYRTINGFMYARNLVRVNHEL